MNSMSRPSAEKRDRLASYLANHALDEVWLTTPENFGWLFNGNNLVNRSAGHGVAAARFDGENLAVLTSNIEADRIRTEELPDGIDVKSFPWHHGTLETEIPARAAGEFGADIPLPGAKEIDGRPFRLPLTSEDVEEFKQLGQDTATALEAVARSLTPQDRERDVAARLRDRLARDEIDAPVALVGGSERAQLHRHFVPTNSRLERYGILSVCGRRNGHWVSASRTVAFTPPEWLHDRHHAACQIEATANAVAATQAGTGTAADAFAAIQEAYDTVGYPDEWRRHHQGGAAGFGSREWVATPNGTEPLESPVPYAWNPTIQGAKSEDTILVADDEISTLTRTGNWPTSEISAVGEAGTISAHDILHLES